MRKIYYNNPLLKNHHHLDDIMRPSGDPIKWWSSDILDDAGPTSSQWEHLREVFIVADQVLSEDEA